MGKTASETNLSGRALGHVRTLHDVRPPAPRSDSLPSLMRLPTDIMPHRMVNLPRPPRPERILVVDDEPWITEVIVDQLLLEGFQSDATNDSTEVMDLLSGKHYDLVILDIHMPAPNGLTLLREIQARDPFMPVLMLTAFSDAETATQAMHDGASDYVVKPHHGAQLAMRIVRALERGQLLRERAEAQALLERRVDEQTRQLRDQARQLTQMLERMTVTYQATVKALEATLDVRDQSAPGHCQRVARLAVQLARKMGVKGDDLMALEHGARLHDIGKLGIPDGILMKPGPLTEAEWRSMQKHPEIGRQIVAHIDFLAGALPIIQHHHEHYAGSGYPDGLQGSEIPLLARIFSVVDAFDAQTHTRPYNTVLTPQKALDNIRASAGTVFDPQVVDVFAALLLEQALLEEQAAANQNGNGTSDPLLR
jgi:cyclic di-GMP phosphodiesterase